MDGNTNEMKISENNYNIPANFENIEGIENLKSNVPIFLPQKNMQIMAS